jgi:hypothetical protein
MPCGWALYAYLGLSIWDGSARTLQFQIDSWQNKSWGLHDIDRQRFRCEVAIAGDGSRANRCELEYFHHYFVPDGHWTIRTLYLRSENALFHIEDATRSVRGGPCSCTWQPMSVLADDSECSKTAQARLSGGKRLSNGRIASIDVVRYHAVDETGEKTELSLAPQLACEVMEEMHTQPGTLGIPGAKRQYCVISYKAGEPDSGFFRMPVGYIVQQKGQ